MPVPTMSYVLSHIYANIPKYILTRAFEPKKYNTTIDARIIDQIIYGRVKNDTNLIAGKRTTIQLLNEWVTHRDMPQDDAITGSAYQASYYAIPAAAREHRNISSVEALDDYYVSALPLNNETMGSIGNIGNTLTGLASAAVTTRTLKDVPIMPQITLNGSNILRVYPDTFSDGLLANVWLDYDAEFTNANTDVIYWLRELCLNATKTYIWTKLVIDIDAQEIVAGSPLGVFKDIISEYKDAANEYHECLMRVRGGQLMDSRTLPEFIRMQL